MLILTKPKIQLRHENNQFFEIHQEQRLSQDTKLFPANERIDRVQYYQSRPLEFMAAYMPADFGSEFADHHPNMIQYLNIRGRLVVIIIFRNAGKGTILKGYTVHAICYGKEPYLTRLEHDRAAATNELLDLSREFKANAQIIADFGHLPGDIYGLPWRPSAGEVFFCAPQLPGIYRENEFVYVRYAGLQNLIRGTVTLNRKRIGRIIVNDPVKGYEEAHSHAHTIKTMSTIKADAGFSGGAYKEKPISMTIVGTCQAKGDVMDRLRSEPMARVLELPGVAGDSEVIRNLMETVSEDIPNIRDYVDRIEQEEGRSTTQNDHIQYITIHADKYGKYLEQVQSTWQTRVTVADYIFIAANWGIEYFLQEIQHESIDLALQRFHASWFPHYTEIAPDEYITPPSHRITEHPNIYLMTIDVAGEPIEGSDPYAILSGVFHKEQKNFYVKHFWCDQATPNDLGDHLYKIFWQSFPWYQGRDVTIYLEDTVQFSGIGREFLNIFRKTKIQEIKDEWTERVNHVLHNATPDRYEKLREDILTQQEIAISAAKQYWIKLPVKLLKPASMGNKLAGIAALRPIAQQQRIYTCPTQSQQKLLIQQFENHKGKHTHGPAPMEFKNEGPDCMRMAFYILRKVHKIVPLFVMRRNEIPTIREEITAQKNAFTERMQLTQR